MQVLKEKQNATKKMAENFDEIFDAKFITLRVIEKPLLINLIWNEIIRYTVRLRIYIMHIIIH